LCIDKKMQFRLEQKYEEYAKYLDLFKYPYSNWKNQITNYITLVELLLFFQKKQEFFLQVSASSSKILIKNGY